MTPGAAGTKSPLPSFVKGGEREARGDLSQQIMWSNLVWCDLGVRPNHRGKHMLTLAGYEIHEQLSTSTRSQIFRARRSADQQPVIIKIPSPEFPSPQDLSRFRHEFDMGRAIDAPHVIHYYAIEDYSHGLALIEEDFGA